MDTQNDREPIARHLLTASSAILGVTLACVAAFTGTYALWQDSVQIDAPTIQSGTLELTINSDSSASLDPSAWEGMLPGERRAVSIDVKNGGSVTSEVTATVDALAPHFAVRLAPTEDECTELTGGTLLGANEERLGLWEPDETRQVCLSVELSNATSSELQGDASQFTISLVATQQGSWN